MPVATNLEIVKSGNVLTGKYKYSSANGTEEADTVCEWLVDGKTAGKGTSYIIDFTGSKSVEFRVTPVSTKAPFEGETVSIKKTFSNGGGSSAGGGGGSKVSSTILPNLPQSQDNVSNELKIVDTAGHWAEKYAREAVEKKIMQVDSNKNFYPDKQVTKADDEFLNGLTDKSVRDEILVTHLGELGITDYGEISDYVYNSKETTAPVLTQDNQRMELAKYPDEGYLKIGATAEGGDGTGPMTINISEKIENAAQWKSDEIYADGYINVEWKDSRAKVNITEDNGDYIFKAVDENLEIEPKSGQRVRFINVPEEISKPGEWYIDRNSVIYESLPNADMPEFDKIGVLK